MSDSDRLQQLLRQRELAREQLAWLDREIAAASAGATTPTPPAPAPVAPQPVPPPPAATPTPGYVASQASALLQRSAPPAPASDERLPAADQILEQYRVAPEAMKTDIRKGCLLYFFGALALVALGVAVLYYLFQRGK